MRNITVRKGGTDNGLDDITEQLGIANGNDRGPGVENLTVIRGRPDEDGRLGAGRVAVQLGLLRF